MYVFSNPGLTPYKVGSSTRVLYLRAAEVTREYGTVYPFEIASRHAVDDPPAVEAMAHRILDRKGYRVARSELFACDLKTCQRAIKAAALLVLERPLWLRLWHWLVLPSPRPKRAPQRWRRSRRGSLAPLLLLALALAVAEFKPELPPWLPASVLRLVYHLERFP